MTSQHLDAEITMPRWLVFMSPTDAKVIPFLMHHFLHSILKCLYNSNLLFILVCNYGSFRRSDFVNTQVEGLVLNMACHIVYYIVCFL